MSFMNIEKFNKDCLFCKIIKKELPCYKIYENEFILAFLDINPYFKGHTLVIPKKHFVNIFDCDERYLCEIIKAIKLISCHYKRVLGCSGVNILNASGKDAEQSVLHTHFHIAPRFKEDNFNIWPVDVTYKKEDLENLAIKLKLI
jgi:histidine triad (HIT) family protein